MNTDELILPFLASGGMWTLLVGAFAIWRYTERTLLQRLLILMAITWFAYGAWYMVRHYLLGYDFNNRILAFNRVSWGVVMALATVAYPITAICKEWLRNRIFKVFIIVPLVVFAIYIGYWLFTGLGFEDYTTYEQLRGHWLDTAVLLRLVIWFISISYNLIALYLMLMAAPIYETYIRNTYSNLEYNLRWIRVVSAFFIGNIIVYTLNIFWFEPWTRLLFMAVNFPLWVFLMEQGIFRKSFTPADDFIISWSWRAGWHEVYTEKDGVAVDRTDAPAFDSSSMVKPFCGNPAFAEVSPVTDNRAANGYAEIAERMEHYMASGSPYIDSNLTREAFAKAVGTNRTTMLFAIRLLGDDSFQDYINRYRIEHFKKLAAANPNAPVTSLFLQSGFTTRSTFYRYFKEAEGMLPSEYMQTISKTLDIRS